MSEVLMVRWAEVEQMSAGELSLYIGSLRHATQRAKEAIVTPIVALAFLDAQLLLIEKLVAEITRDQKEYTKGQRQEMRAKLEAEKRNLIGQRVQVKKHMRVTRN